MMFCHVFKFQAMLAYVVLVKKLANSASEYAVSKSERQITAGSIKAIKEVRKYAVFYTNSLKLFYS